MPELSQQTDQLPTVPPEPSSEQASTPTAEVLPESSERREQIIEAIGPGRFPGIRAPFRSVVWLVRVLLGIVVLAALLSGLAAVPGLSLLALGIMLAAEAEVATSGRLRQAFPLLPVATRTGTVCLMTGLFLFPVWLASSLVASHAVIAGVRPDLPTPPRMLLTLLQMTVFCHVLLAFAGGGRLSCFLRPFRNARQVWSDMASGRWTQQVNLWAVWLLELFRPVRHLGLALKAVLGAVIWLTIPTLLLSAATRPHQDPGGPALVSLLGGLLLIPIASWLPLLQAHQAATGRFSAIFEVGQVRQRIARVPWHWAVATILLYASAIPLYLTKIRLIDQGAVWLLTPLFIVLIYPNRLMFGWVYARGSRQTLPAPRWQRWPLHLVMIPVLAAYVGILFLTPFVSEAGRAAIFENHAFLLPVPGRLFGS